MKLAVIGAGAWGLPAASQLAQRGHDVTLIDRDGVLNEWSSSLGPTRLWRLADPDPVRARLSIRALEAMRRLQESTGAAVYLRPGLLWRDTESLDPVVANLRANDLGHVEVAAADVERFFPGLRPDGRDAVWVPDAGVVLSETSLQAQYRLFVRAGGIRAFGRTVSAVVVEDNGIRLTFGDGERFFVDRLVVAAGPGSADLLAGLDVDIPLHPYLEQVVHFGEPAPPLSAHRFPCLFDGPREAEPGIYAMPSPGRGFKVGLDLPLRDFTDSDRDRTPDRQRTAAIRDRVRRDLRGVHSSVLDAQVCSWTDSPDGNFVVGVLGERVVIACGDSGEGFKFSALMGEVLADLAEGRPVDPDVATWSPARFADGAPDRSGPHQLGRH